MYSFEGEFRRLPEQNLAGASKKQEREELLNRAHLERLKREEYRRRQHSTLCIQSYIRSYQTRQKQKTKQRDEFDLLVENLKNNPPDDAMLAVLVQKLLFFYNQNIDTNRVVSIINILMRYLCCTILILLFYLFPGIWLLGRGSNLMHVGFFGNIF
uniref:HECT-type E3 ubiquitin transferase n=1 Tax=Clastoptera arizonana TaxID=38151 RepID=A0A1B6E9F9_9HEMI